MTAIQHTSLDHRPLDTPPTYLPKPAGPVQLILDTDMGNDCDDALALGMILALEARGACKLLGVTLTNPEKLAGAHVAAVNAFYGRPDIPVGVSPAAPFVRPSPFLKVVERLAPDGTPLYPYSFEHDSAPRAVPLLRRLLSEAEDRSVVIAQIGFFTNCAALLASGPDEFSELGGRELVARKVRFFSVMAGAFGPVQQNNYWLEFNVVYDKPAAIRLAAEWPTPVVWSGAEVGEAVLFPAHAVEQDYGYQPNHILKETYQLFRPTPHERPCWDLTTALYAIFPDRDYFGLSVAGSVEVLPDGYTRFKPGKGARDRFLALTEKQAGVLRGLFSALATEPPRHPGAIHSAAACSAASSSFSA